MTARYYEVKKLERIDGIRTATEIHMRPPSRAEKQWTRQSCGSAMSDTIKRQSMKIHSLPAVLNKVLEGLLLMPAPLLAGDEPFDLFSGLDLPFYSAYNFNDTITMTGPGDGLRRSCRARRGGKADCGLGLCRQLERDHRRYFL